MTASQIAARKTYDTRVAELRAQGKRLSEAHTIAKREDIAAQTAAWRAQDSERQ
jgi:hypothetical protein